MIRKKSLIVIIVLFLVLFFAVRTNTNYSKIVVRAVQATVKIENNGWQGSGVIVNKKGLILTAKHVLKQKKNQKILIMLFDKRKFEGKTIWISKEVDIALIKIISPPENLVVAEISKIHTSSVFAVGYPNGKQTIRFGKILSDKVYLSKEHKNGEVIIYIIRDVFGKKKFHYILTNINIAGGYSGGPLFNTRGEVVGIVDSKLTYKNQKNESIFTPAKELPIQ